VRFLLATAVKDLVRRRRDPLALLLWAGIPLAIGGLIFLAFGGDDAGPSGRLLIVDQDNTVLSGLLSGVYQQGPLAEIIEVEAVDLETGRERIDGGEAAGLLIIPDGFGTAVLNSEPFEISLVRNPAQRIVPGIIEESLSLVVESTFYLQRLFDEPLDIIAATQPVGANIVPDSTVASISVAFNQIVDRTRPYLFPPVIELETKTTGEDEDGFDFARLFFPSMLFMALLFMAQGLSEDIWRERSQGTLRRVIVTPQRVATFLAGKLLASATLMLVVIGLGLIAGRWVFGIELHGLPIALVWATIAGMMLLAMMVLVQLFASSERAGNILTGAAIFPLAMLGGSFFPFEVMPDWLASVGRYTPNGWALAKLNQVFAGDLAVLELIRAIGFVTLIIVVLTWLAMRRIRGRFAHS
jgi:ABC-type multidrug transport system permease subunit